MRIIPIFLVLLVSAQLAFGKAVDVQTAGLTAYGFCKSEGIAVNQQDVSLIYTATATVQGTPVNDYYIFSLGATGFVIISADDNITPVLGFSAESPAKAGNWASNVAYWLNNYAKQINYVIENGITVPEQAAKWTGLQNGVRVAQRTTSSGVVAPLLHTAWDQEPYYNALCPYDYSADTNVVTGCVATAMAQVMKYWNWPVKGVGSHSYDAGSYGTLTANFDSTVYQWDSMSNYLTKVDTAIAVLMLQCGVSVDMQYSVTESGSYVNIASSPITNCAEYALQTYFRYSATTIQGIDRYAYSDSDWVNTIKSELDAHRPVIYTGDGTVGGHCFIADGYTTADRIHINWGWGGSFNGFFVFDNLAPGSMAFNDNQTLLIGIQPDTVGTSVDTTVTPVVSGVKQVAAAGKTSIYPNPAADVVNINLAGETATRVSLVDMEGRELLVVTPGANSHLVTIPVNNIPEGVYFVQIQSASGTLSKKIVVAR